MALINVTNIPSDREPFIDERTGLVSRTWYRFLLRLFTITGAGSTTFTVEDLQKAPPTPEFILPTFYTFPPFNIVLTGSPFTYQNVNNFTIDVLIGGTIGGVVKLEFSRDNITWYDTGSFYGMFTLSPYDYLRITYVTAPTVTGIPR